MNNQLPLCLLRLWCRRNNSWLSFKTVQKDRFLVNPSGYFIELPDGSLTPISPRVTFPADERFPAVPLDDLSIRQQFGDDARFLAVPLVVAAEQEPAKVDIDLLREDPLHKMDIPDSLDRLERYVLARALETGLVSSSGFSKMLELRTRFKTIGSALVYGGICKWEMLLGYCLDTRPASTLDPPALRQLIERREWELTGEILLALGLINRTHLEYAFKLKREGSQALGQILVGMNVCKETDIERCLKIQTELRLPPGGDLALIGKLLIDEGLVSADDVEEALRNQRIARQPLAKILVMMGACAQKDIDGYSRSANLQYASEIDDVKLSEYLLKTETITKIHLEEALRIQRRGRQVLGELLVSSGHCQQQSIDDMVLLQRQVRETHRVGVEKIGSILMHVCKVPEAKIDEAMKLQNLGRQPFGSILVTLGYCSDEDIEKVLEIQELWRKQEKPQNDRLGEVLVQQGVISEDILEQALEVHRSGEQPLGRILVDRSICTPEQIIEALIQRDDRRHHDFLKFVGEFGLDNSNVQSSFQQTESSEHNEAARKPASLVDKLSSWLRPKGKP